MVVEITVVDDRRVELLGVVHHRLVGFVGDHRRELVGLWVYIVVEVGDDSRELFLGLLVKIGHGNSRSEDGVVWVGCGHVGSGLGSLGMSAGVGRILRDFETYQVVELNGGDTLVDTSNDLHGDCSGIDVLGVKAITEPRDASCDLVELHALLAAIYASRQQEFSRCGV